MNFYTLVNAYANTIHPDYGTKTSHNSSESHFTDHNKASSNEETTRKTPQMLADSQKGIQHDYKNNASSMQQAALQGN